MNRTRMLVLANSWKHGDWCLAGIDLATGKWVRPVSALNDGRVPEADMKLGGYFPELRDIISLPLADSGPDFGFERENRSILPGQWTREDKMRIADLTPYVERPEVVLHNSNKYVTLKEMRAKPFHERVTLQLVYLDSFTVRDGRATPLDHPKWLGTLTSGGRALELKISDPVFCKKLDEGHSPSNRVLLTMSLGMPHRPPDWPRNRPPACWKLIAAVIELPRR